MNCWILKLKEEGETEPREARMEEVEGGLERKQNIRRRWDYTGGGPKTERWSKRTVRSPKTRRSYEELNSLKPSKAHNQLSSINPLK